MAVTANGCVVNAGLSVSGNSGAGQIAVGAVALAMAMTACAGQVKGTVIERDHTASGWSYVFGGKHLHWVYTPETWTLIVEDGNTTQSQEVSSNDWGNCPVRSQYPDCTKR
jgi:hypothetical protein